jgi:FMN phosphatase YigB (HAD superfamily)/DNA-binding XRE family transcriptional regulator
MDGEGTVKPEFALGKAIADARRKAGMTQQDLCMKANLSYSTLAKIERGAIKTPSVFTVMAIAQATGTPIEQLVGSRPVNTSQTPQKAYKTSKTGIKFVYFDVNGTMVRFFQRAFTNIAADSGVPEEAIERLFWQYNDAICRGQMSLDDFNRQLADMLHWGEISWADYYIKNVDPVRDIQELATWVADNYKIGILTNAMPGLTHLLIDRGMIPRLPYSAIVDSSEVHSIKPEQDIYFKAAELAGLAPEHILTIDDNQTNLIAAEKLGWQTLWFDDYRPYEGVDRIRQMLEF